MKKDLPKPPRVSELLTATLQAWPEERISFGALVDATQGRGFGALVVLVSLPCLIPLPVGFSGPLFGGMLCLMAAQMIIGFEHPWLPAWVERAPIVAPVSVTVAPGSTAPDSSVTVP